MKLRDPLPNHDSVAVLGLGAAGLGAARLLRRLGKHVVASDRGAPRPADLPPDVEVHFGTNEVGAATAAVLSPGLNPSWPENRDNQGLAHIWATWARGELELWSEVELAAAAVDVPWVAIGGTDGKSTTAALCNHLARQLGLTTVFGGNSWEALSSVVERAEAADLAVVEVSAFQTWRPHRMRPAAVILTNIADDHLDHYAHIDDYVEAKLALFDNLADETSQGIAIIYGSDPRLAAAALSLRARGVRTAAFDLTRPIGSHDLTAWRDGELLRLEGTHTSRAIPLNALALPGEHNIRNALAAITAIDSVTSSRVVTDEELAAALAGFRGLPHRIELIRELDGVRYYNDSKATNVHAAVTGVRALAAPLVAIVGGVDKGLSLEPLVDALSASARHVIVIGAVTARFVTEAADRFPVSVAESLDDAVVAARAIASPGDSVVLAPACSSFDMFRSFEHRGDVFRAAVEGL